MVLGLTLLSTDYFSSGRRFVQLYIVVSRFNLVAPAAHETSATTGSSKNGQNFLPDAARSRSQWDDPGHGRGVQRR